MALTVAQYRTMRDLFRGRLSVDSANPTDSDVLAFFKQFLAEASGAPTLSTGRQTLASRIANEILSGNFSNPSDANILDFWVALANDANAGAAMGTTEQYRAMKKGIVGMFACDFFNPVLADVLSYINAVAPTQTPLTIITSTTVKLWTDSQLGAGANTWTDQSGLGNNFTEATNPPVLTTVGGVPCYVSNGTNQLFTAASLTLTLGQWYWIIARQVTWLSNGSLCGGAASASASILSLSLSTPQIAQFNSTEVNTNGAMTLGTWFRVKALFGNSTADYLQVGTTKVTGASTGPGTETGWQIFTRQSFGWGNFAIAAVVVAAAEPTAPEQAALDAYGAARWPGVSF